MIKAINTGSGIQVDSGYTSWPSFYTNPSSSNTLVGQVRYNGASQNMEVYDGSNWLVMSAAFPTLNLAPHVQAVVEWAQKKMAEEENRKQLAQKHPAFKDALDALQRAQEQVRIVEALVQE